MTDLSNLEDKTNIDNVFDIDKLKLRLMMFDSPSISINNKSITRADDGKISNLNDGDVINSFICSPYVINAITGEKASLTDVDGYYYESSMSFIPTNSDLPSRLVFSYENNDNIVTSNITGTVVSLTESKYEFLIRATLQMFDTSNNLIRSDNTDLYCYFDSEGLSSDFKWNEDWLSGLDTGTIAGTTDKFYSFGDFPLGDTVSIPFEIDNQPEDLLYTTTAYTSNFILNDTGVKIIDNGLQGIISVYNTPGTYYFRITAYRSSDTSDIGTPATSNTIFGMTITNEVVDSTTGPGLITWNTDGYLGVQYETYPSIFGVSASIQNGNSITYTVSPNTPDLMPPSMSIDPNTGLFLGECPFVDVKTTYKIKVRATSGSIYSEKVFYFVIYPFYYTSNIFNLEIPVTGDIREQIAVNSWDTSVIPPNRIYRFLDNNFGRKRNQDIYFISGLVNNLSNIGYWKINDASGTGVSLPSDPSLYDDYDSCFYDKLRNYHRPFDLYINGIGFSPVYDPLYNHIADVVYYTLTDKKETSSGFDSNGYEELVFDTQKKNDVAIPQFNMPEGATRIYPTSVSNCRNDLIQTKNRQTIQNYMIRPNATPGVGLQTKEGLPMWSLNPSSQTTSNLGFVACIEICYCEANYGASISTRIKLNSTYNMIGKNFTVDRYILTTYGTDPSIKNKKIIKFPPGDLNLPRPVA